jgi:hypothetical protein
VSSWARHGRRAPASGATSTPALFYSPAPLETPRRKPASKLARRLGVPLDGHVIGGNGPLIGRTGEWTDIYGIGPDRVVLVRPYGHVAWRANSAQPEAGKVLKGAFRQLLHHN